MEPSDFNTILFYVVSYYGDEVREGEFESPMGLPPLAPKASALAKLGSLPLSLLDPYVKGEIRTHEGATIGSSILNHSMDMVSDLPIPLTTWIPSL